MLNVINPEAVVARHNLRLARPIDPVYLAEHLSDDAVPTIVDALPTLAPPDRAELQALLCASGSTSGSGPFAWNGAAAAADAARRRICPPSG